MPDSMTGPDPTNRSVRDLIFELSRTEDALREWRVQRGRREAPQLDVRSLLGRQRDLVAELRRRSEGAGPDAREQGHPLIVDATEPPDPVAC